MLPLQVRMLKWADTKFFVRARPACDREALRVWEGRGFSPAVAEQQEMGFSP